MKHFLLLVMALSTLSVVGQDVIKIDFDQSGRNTNEVTEPGYTAWPISGVASASKTFNDVTITVAETNGKMLKSNWCKALIQSPHYARLVNDGVTTDEEGGSIDISISGLPAGTHSIQTYNNSWENGTTFEMIPFDVFLNGEKVQSAVEPTVRVEKTTDATRLYMEFSVNGPDDVTIVRFAPVTEYTLKDASKTLYNRVFVDAIEIGLPNAGKQASLPYPANNDTHANCDGGMVQLSWSPAEGAVSHTIYFGTDSATVANMEISAALATLADTTYYVEDLSHHHTYWWRVDETDASGNVTNGETWNFRPRHLAFRTAEGYGKYAIGGRGGKVVYVTNLNDDGPGSFREALTNDIGPRTIVFNVSGVIRLESRLTSVGKYITVAGQTAPGKGICFRAAPLGIGSDAVWRFVRMRLGSGKTYDGIGMAGADHSILDHASISWTIDEAFSSRGAKNITLQRSLISEALNVAGHENYEYGQAHGYAGSVGGDIASLHHNLLAHNDGRNWSMAGGLDGANYYAGRLDIFNTVVYNWGGRTTDGGAHEVNFVGNYYKKGAACRRTVLLRADLEGTGLGSQSYYYHNNILAEANGKLVYNGTNDAQGREYRTTGGQVVDWTVFVKEPFFPSLAKIESAADTYKSVLSDVGCNMPLFDDHDTRIVREVKTGTYTYKGSYTDYPGLPDNEYDVGGYEDYPVETRDANFDTDMDGLPDWWESLFGTSTQSPAGDFSDSNADPDNDGYTALDNYLEWMSRPHYYIYNNAPAVINLNALVSNYKAPYNFEITDADGHEISEHGIQIAITDSVATVSATAAIRGVAFLTVTATDAEGSVATAHIAVANMGETSSDICLPTEDALQGSGTIRIYDAAGHLISSQTVNYDQTDINGTIPALPAGIYMVQMTGKNGTYTKKLVAQ